MSLNDYFAANGAVYLRPMGLPDCFTMPGLPHGIKPPPMPLQQKPRSMAAVSPLHQGIPPPPSMGAYEGGGFGGAPSNNRTSSFAAALRKLAKQAVDPVAGEKDPTQISPVASPSLSQGGPLTPKRSAPANSGGAPPPPPPMFHQGASYGSSSSPPVVTIAPSRPVATHTSESRKVVDLSNVPPTNNPNPISNGHMQQETPMKMDSTKGLPRHPEKWDESTLSSKGLSVSSASSQVRPHATIAPLPRPDDSVTSSRGFQPYRGGGSEESPRNTLPHHLSLFEHHHPSYPYAPAFLTPPHHLSHPAYRFDDPLYLERYSLLRPPMLPYAQPSMMGPPPAAFYPSSRYAADLIAQSLSISSANNSMLNHERLKAEEQERRIREKELELKEQERQRDREHREKEHKEREKERRHSKDEQHYEHRKSNSSSSSHSSSSKRTESPNVRTTPVIHSTPNHVSANTIVSSSSSIPLNLVLQEPQRKETTELWMPWQQPANTHAKDASQEIGNNGNKHPAFRTQDVHRHHPTRENHTNDKSNLRFSPSALMDKKQHIPTNDPTTIGDKKHSSDHRTPDYRTQQDNVPSHRTQQEGGVPSHRTPASFEAKDSAPHEWRHEKLQKACTNIHRKVHESKRANNQKDGLYQNHHHHRKVVNGALLKPSTTLYQNEGIHTTLYQNEGMHARLLESEKCRLEMNGHVVKSPGNAGLVVPSPYKLSSDHYQKDLPQKSFADYFGSSGVLLKSSVEVSPVVSKLDIELRRLKKGETVCVDEERRMRNLLIIAKMPQLKFDSNPHKLNFLRLFGLTTHLKKKKVEFDMFLKRRKRLRQDSSLSPVSLLKEEAGRRDEEEDDDPVLEKRKNPVEVECLAERLRAEDTSSKKAEFLSMFGLKPFTLELREEKVRLRRKVSEEKSRRHYRLLATVNRKSSPKRLFVPKSEAAQRLDQLKKLSEMNALPNGLTSKRLDEDEETSDIKHTPTGQTVAPKVEQVPYTLSPECNPLNKSSYSSAAHKSFNKYSFKRGHSLKREFRFATPQSNYKSNPESLKNGVVPSRSTPPFTGAAAPATRCSVGTQVDANTDRCVAELKSSLSLSATIDTIMEVIYRNQTEQSSEKNVLSERCQQLRLTQEELKKQADALSRQMSDLLRSKRELDEERQGHQQSIDHLKKCLQLGR